MAERIRTEIDIPALKSVLNRHPITGNAKMVAYVMHKTGASYDEIATVLDISRARAYSFVKNMIRER